MSHFYGNMQGTKGETTRCGTKNSGMWCHIRGWNTGVYVQIDNINGEDVVKIYRTRGSNAGGFKENLLYAFTQEKFL